MKKIVTYKSIPKCERCKYGQVLTDWDGKVCVQCGYRPDDANNALEVYQRRQDGKREPRPPSGKKKAP